VLGNNILVGQAMKFPRRQFLHLAAGAAALPAVSRVAWAQTYPTRPVRMIVGFAAGQQIDILARLMGQWLSERLGHPFIIENRPGSGGNVAAEIVVRASPDGYTLLLVGANNYINATLYNNLNFNFIRDIAPVVGLVRGANIMEVHPSVPVATVDDFISYAKVNPGKLNMASAGNGSTSHIYGELFKMMTGVNILHVPYRGSAPALTDLLGGQVQVMFDNMGSTAATRLEVLPNIPPVGEFVPGYEATSVGGVGLPRGTPADIIDKLSDAINTALPIPR
jgi:tripartite-type tricarboxylate transporter receptor subunit TctC